MASSSGKSLIKSTTGLLKSEKYSDLTIATKVRFIKVHKSIVCTQSKVLAAMSDAGFKESFTALLPLEHDDPMAVECMVKFFYSGDYDAGITKTGPCLMSHVAVYALADKYDVEALEKLIADKFDEKAEGTMCEDFPAIVAAVFETTPSSNRGLRDVVSRICASHIDAIYADETWNETLASNGDIALSISKLARQNSIAEVDKANTMARNNEQDLDRTSRINQLLRETFDQMHDDLRRIRVDWDDMRGANHECECGCNAIFEAMTSDMDGFKQEMPTSFAIHYL